MTTTSRLKKIEERLGKLECGEPRVVSGYLEGMYVRLTIPGELKHMLHRGSTIDLNVTELVGK